MSIKWSKEANICLRIRKRVSKMKAVFKSKAEAETGKEWNFCTKFQQSTMSRASLFGEFLNINPSMMLSPDFRPLRFDSYTGSFYTSGFSSMFCTNFAVLTICLFTSGASLLTCPNKKGHNFCIFSSQVALILHWKSSADCN